MAIRPELMVEMWYEPSKMESFNLPNHLRRGVLAERGGFEPPIGLHLCRISSAVQSTTLPPLRGAETTGKPVRLWGCSMRGFPEKQGGKGGDFQP